MGTAANNMPNRKRVRYSAEYRAEALALAERQRRCENARLKRQPAEKSEEVEILGKPQRTWRISWTEVPAIHQHRSAHSIACQCAVLAVSRNGYYAWLHRRDSVSQRLPERAKRDAKVVEVFEAKKRRYGSPRLREELGAEGMARSRKTVAESMRPQGLRASAAKRFRHTTDSGHSLGVAPDLLA